MRTPQKSLSPADWKDFKENYSVYELIKALLVVYVYGFWVIVQSRFRNFHRILTTDNRKWEFWLPVKLVLVFFLLIGLIVGAGFGLKYVIQLF